MFPKHTILPSIWDHRYENFIFMNGVSRVLGVWIMNTYVPRAVYNAWLSSTHLISITMDKGQIWPILHLSVAQRKMPNFYRIFLFLLVWLMIGFLFVWFCFVLFFAFSNWEESSHTLSWSHFSPSIFCKWKRRKQTQTEMFFGSTIQGQALRNPIFSLVGSLLPLEMT